MSDQANPTPQVESTPAPAPQIPSLSDAQLQQLAKYVAAEILNKEVPAPPQPKVMADVTVQTEEVQPEPKAKVRKRFNPLPRTGWMPNYNPNPFPGTYNPFTNPYGTYSNAGYWARNNSYR